MPVAKEFVVHMGDRPGTLGKLCRALAERGVNVLGFQSFSSEGESVFRFVVDSPTTAKAILEDERVRYTEFEVAQVRLPHRPGELARAASKLGQENININYSYSALDPATKAPMLIFGVTDVQRAASFLDETALAA